MRDYVAPALIPDDAYVPFDAINAATELTGRGIAQRAHAAGVEAFASIGGGGWLRSEDLPRVFSPPVVRAILATRREPQWLLPHHALGLVRCTVTELVPLCGMRGVSVLGSYPAKVSRAGVFALARCLELEVSRWPIDPDDYITAAVALPAIRRAQRTQVNGEWASDIDVNDPNRPRLAETYETVTRCQWSTIRFRRGGAAEWPGRRPPMNLPYMVCGFDLYRILGIDDLAGQDLETYRARLAEVYAEVCGSAAAVPAA